MAERSAALLGFVAQQEVRHEEAEGRGAEGENGDEPEGWADSHGREGEGGEVRDEESSDAAQELVERMSFGGSVDELEVMSVRTEVEPCCLERSAGDTPEVIERRFAWPNGFGDCSARPVEPGRSRPRITSS